MNCQNFEKMILVVAQNRLPDTAVRNQSLTHAESCAWCAKRLAEERALITGMRAVVADIADLEAPKRLEAALLTAFRGQIKPAATLTQVPRPIKSNAWSRRRLASIAAGMILLISAVAILWGQSNSLTRQRKEQAVAPTIPLAPETQPSSPEPQEPQVVHVTARPSAGTPHDRVRHQRVRNRLNETEVVTEFFPLLEGDDLDALESGQIVRVELPGSALLAVGLPVDAAMASEPIKADVVLGHDGMARAIRFVR